jgi:hypothetical protein
VHIEGEHNEIADALLQNCTIYRDVNTKK